MLIDCCSPSQHIFFLYVVNWGFYRGCLLLEFLLRLILLYFYFILFTLSEHLLYLLFVFYVGKYLSLFDNLKLVLFEFFYLLLLTFEAGEKLLPLFKLLLFQLVFGFFSGVVELWFNLIYILILFTLLFLLMQHFNIWLFVISTSFFFFGWREPWLDKWLILR